MREQTQGEYSVVQFFPDETYEYVRRYVDINEAILTATDYTQRPAAQIGIIRKVLITDGGDFINFQWEYGKGVTYPLPKRKSGVEHES